MPRTITTNDPLHALLAGRTRRVDMFPAWAPDDHAAELACNERLQQALDEQASEALHRDVDIPRWRLLTQKQIALSIERILNTESRCVPLGGTVRVSNPLGRSYEYARTPWGWERLGPLAA